MRPFDLLQQQAERASTRVALRHKSDALTYRELLDRVNQASQQLIEHGVSKGDRVALYLQKNIDLVVYLLAANAIRCGIRTHQPPTQNPAAQSHPS